MKNMCKIIIIPFLLFYCFSYSQYQKSDFNIYVFKSRYSEEGKSFINEQPYLSEIKLLGGYMIDPHKKGTINLESVDKHLKKLFPKPNDEGVLCVNLENRYYDNIRNYDVTHRKYKEAIQEFKKLINFIRIRRPNVKLGIYGLPYRTYYKSQTKWNVGTKLDAILSEVDYIFPSLYVLYPDKEKGEKANNIYWNKNLDTAFSYADRLDKKVIPFVWYIVSTNNKMFGGELLGKNEMSRYLEHIKNYISPYNCKVDGVVWWESSKKSFKKNVQSATHLNESIDLKNSTILKTYTQHLKN
ncbi:hypothetical protein [uncultured Marixanthomonas sp.]|uniref:hypothetical protein n=1 Tax=uncultured Marixanthomonas sp. TaxID=757245 RepID=UPI0030D8B914|tara:strand:+ start:9392 stop:10285 length:894 start_codon:yes stop_codon:yes gene_type:complete